MFTPGPEIHSQVYFPVFRHLNPFFTKQRLLQPKTFLISDCYPASGIDDPVPRQAVFPTHGVKDSDHLPGRSGITGQGGNSPVGAYPAPGNSLYDLQDAPGKRGHENACRIGGMYFT